MKCGGRKLVELNYKVLDELESSKYLWRIMVANVKLEKNINSRLFEQFKLLYGKDEELRNGNEDKDRAVWEYNCFHGEV